MLEYRVVLCYIFIKGFGAHVLPVCYIALLRHASLGFKWYLIRFTYVVVVGIVNGRTLNKTKVRSACDEAVTTSGPPLLTPTLATEEVKHI